MNLIKISSNGFIIIHRKQFIAMNKYIDFRVFYLICFLMNYCKKPSNIFSRLTLAYTIIFISINRIVYEINKFCIQLSFPFIKLIPFLPWFWNNHSILYFC